MSSVTWLIHIVMTAALSIALFATTYESDKSLKWKPWFYGRPYTLIADHSLGSRNGNPRGGRRLVDGRWFIRVSKDTNGSITFRSTSEWIMILFVMASLIEFYPS